LLARLGWRAEHARCRLPILPSDSRANTPDAGFQGNTPDASNGESNLPDSRANTPDARFQVNRASLRQPARCWIPGKQPARFPMPAFQVKTGQVDAQQKRAGVFPLPLRGFF